MPEVTSRLVTYSDLISHSVDYLGAVVSGDATRDARRAVQAAYRSLATMHNWSYYVTRGRLVTNASYSTGTIEYDHTGGAEEMLVTLTDGTFPSWAYLGDMLINGVVYEIASIVNSTSLTLSRNSNPGEDIAAGETYVLYRDTYPLPVDFQAADDFTIANNSRLLSYVSPNQWLEYGQNSGGVGDPSRYTFRSDPNYYGTMAISFVPAPSGAESYDYIYKRRPRPMMVQEYKAGTATATFASATVTGSGTTWKDNHIGAVMRFSETNDYPTGLTGDNPFEIQRIVASVESETSLTLDRIMPQAFTSCKYTIGDPADIEDGAMLTALYREIEKELRISRRMKPSPEEEERYIMAINQAREADSRTFSSRATAVGGW